MLSLLRNRDKPALPERVRENIRLQEDATERLISWIQLSVVVSFGMLYWISPAPQVGFDIIPWTLAIYLILTLVRVVWAHYARLPEASLFISILVDVGLLMALIWSFHLRYEQPASFYLKAPTLLYVFIFIALRALRFEARYVVFTGFVAATGWVTLTLYVLYADPNDNMMTRDYVMYLTSNSVLLGAEFDKIISILMVTGIIAYALTRAKNLLVRSVSEQAAAQELSRFFAPEVAARITGSDDHIVAGSGEMRQAAILNLDMRGFTRLAATAAPAEAMQLLSEYQRIMVPIIREHGGMVDKFLGDGILATFGTAEINESYAGDALRALEACVLAAQKWRHECLAAGRACPEVNGAVASGAILFGAVGDEDRLEFTVIGDAVNLSAKIEKQNPKSGVRALCDLATYNLARSQGYEPAYHKPVLSGIDVGGVGEPIDLAVIVD